MASYLDLSLKCYARGFRSYKGPGWLAGWLPLSCISPGFRHLASHAALQTALAARKDSRKDLLRPANSAASDGPTPATPDLQHQAGLNSPQDLRALRHHDARAPCTAPSCHCRNLSGRRVHGERRETRPPALMDQMDAPKRKHHWRVQHHPAE